MLLCIISLRTRRLWHASVAEPKSWVIASLGSLWGKTLLPLLSADDRRRVEANFSMWKRKPGAVTAEHRSLPRRGNWKPIVSGLQKVLTAVISLFEFNPTIVQRGWFLVALLCLRWHVESLAFGPKVHCISEQTSSEPLTATHPGRRTIGNLSRSGENELAGKDLCALLQTGYNGWNWSPSHL